jgi:hypothetical protein
MTGFPNSPRSDRLQGRWLLCSHYTSDSSLDARLDAGTPVAHSPLPLPNQPTSSPLNQSGQSIPSHLRINHLALEHLLSSNASSEKVSGGSEGSCIVHSFREDRSEGSWDTMRTDASPPSVNQVSENGSINDSKGTNVSQSSVKQVSEIASTSGLGLKVHRRSKSNLELSDLMNRLRILESSEYAKFVNGLKG